MANVPIKMTNRISAGIKHFQPILKSAKKRDVNESDTVTILTDIFSDILGFDKYTEITAEHAIRGTYCDIAIEIKSKTVLLIEAKAIGLELKDNHIRQAVDYAVNQGIDWVLLTNGEHWKLYRVKYTKPIDREMVLDFNFLDLSPRNNADIEVLYLLTKEGTVKSLLDEYYAQKKALSRFSVGGVLLSERVIGVIRQELKKLSPDVKIDCERLRTVLTEEVLKREIVEGEKTKKVCQKIVRSKSRPAQKKP